VLAFLLIVVLDSLEASANSPDKSQYPSFPDVGARVCSVSHAGNLSILRAALHRASRAMRS
jgi:hypothetical protein